MVNAVTSRLSGDGARPAFVDLPADPHDQPWVAVDSPVRKVNGDIAMLVGGIRALLLQSLHPVAMRAVLDHSAYDRDPWGRLQRTAGFVAATTYGSTSEAERVIGTVRRIHDRVRGIGPDGRSYRASDPHLLEWVHIAEVESFLTCHRLYGKDQLSSAEADQYVADMARTALALGAVDVPITVDQLDRRLEAYRPELRGKGLASETAELLLWRPPLSGPAQLGYRLLAAGAVASLPTWARPELGLPSLPIVDRTVLRPAAKALLLTLDRAFAGTIEQPAATTG
jgi:uncharacterized protein (DUF2236 family)